LDRRRRGVVFLGESEENRPGKAEGAEIGQVSSFGYRPNTAGGRTVRRTAMRAARLQGVVEPRVRRSAEFGKRTFGSPGALRLKPRKIAGHAARPNATLSTCGAVRRKSQRLSCSAACEASRRPARMATTDSPAP